MKTSREYAKAIEIVLHQLGAWDPYALLAGGAPEDEFESEAALIVSGMRGVTCAEDLAAVVAKVFSSRFADESFTAESCSEVASAMFQALRSEGVLVPNNSLQARRP